MRLPFRVGERVSPEAWHTIRRRAMFECCKWDVQSHDHCVLADFPLWMQRSVWSELSQLAEGLAAETVEAERKLVLRPELLWELSLPRSMIREFKQDRQGDGGGARIMRFDFHFTDQGWQISEVNADVPGGFIEGSGFTKLMAEHFDAEAPSGTAEAYADAIVASGEPRGVVAMVHATAYSDDRQVMEYLGKLIRERGREVVQASPDHVVWRDGRARINSKFADREVAAIVRFFPADWLASLDRQQWGPYLVGSGTPISNPATALLVQSKAFPVVWDRLNIDLTFWRKLLPETRAAREMKNGDEGWVLKPVFGRVGEGVGMMGITPEKEMKEILRTAKSHPRDWVVQRRFHAVPAPSGWGNLYPCIGVYTLNGKTVGAYARISHKPLTDDEAQDVAILFEAGQ